MPDVRTSFKTFGTVDKEGTELSKESSRDRRAFLRTLFIYVVRTCALAGGRWSARALVAKQRRVILDYVSMDRAVPGKTYRKRI